MLIIDPERRRVVFAAPLFAIAGLAFGLLAIGMAGSTDLAGTLGVGLLGLAGLAWFATNVRVATREGAEIVVRGLFERTRVAAEGCRVELEQGGSARAPHLDVLLEPRVGPAARVARVEILGMTRAPADARRVATALGVVGEGPNLGALEARLGEAARSSRGVWPVFGGLVAVGLLASLAVVLVAPQAGTLRVRCPGGQTEFAGTTLIGDVEMTYAPGRYRVELRPVEGPAWVTTIELVAGQTTEVDCRHPASSPSSP